jgi:hypothetical protein
MFHRPGSSRHRKRCSIRRISLCIFIALLLAFWQSYATISRWRVAYSVTERLERHINLVSGSDSQSHSTSTVWSLPQVAPHTNDRVGKSSWESDGRPFRRLTHSLNTISTSRNDDMRHAPKMVLADENKNEVAVVSSLLRQVVDSKLTGTGSGAQPDAYLVEQNRVDHCVQNRRVDEYVHPPILPLRTTMP